MTSLLELTAADGFQFPVYQATPTDPVRGAVVVLQEIFGVNRHIRSVTDGFAAQGYLALAPSTFHRVRQGVDMGYSPEDIAAGVALKAQVEGLPAPGVLADIQATVDHAARQLPSGKVAVVGYCWGGLLAWRAACALVHITAAVPYYGGGMTQPVEIARRPKVPVLAHFAEHDASIPLQGVEAFRLAHPEVALHLYNASHGFNCDCRSAYNAPAASLALERTLSFLEQSLRQ
ncbi:dienelactone hydrolase family protein [Rhodoferax sp. U11-2br]|uniref:dienelactone hydrolase family protein n=1 Tax=Rhodoferax sp. U11-2br TaxID=2838878 RepID=UPI001BEBAAE6|nr:dienelactone hydrolase family protein [Rhodoferax sp. U11-2br]MBT3067770.1 dienelactone hydrolase family protein [Rhodoferax sp. U11-2br]